jgi:hypothetical protein
VLVALTAVHLAASARHPDRFWPHAAAAAGAPPLVVAAAWGRACAAGLGPLLSAAASLRLDRSRLRPDELWRGGCGPCAGRPCIPLPPLEAAAVGVFRAGEAAARAATWALVWCAVAAAAGGEPRGAVAAAAVAAATAAQLAGVGSLAAAPGVRHRLCVVAPKSLRHMASAVVLGPHALRAWMNLVGPPSRPPPAGFAAPAFGFFWGVATLEERAISRAMTWKRALL